MTQPQPTAALTDAQLIDAFETTVIHNSRTWDADIQSRIRATRVELMRRLARAESAPGVSRERLAQVIQPFTPSYGMASKCADAVLAALEGTNHA